MKFHSMSYEFCLIPEKTRDFDTKYVFTNISYEMLAKSLELALANVLPNYF
jgi:hypothetical protein